MGFLLIPSRLRCWLAFYDKANLELFIVHTALAALFSFFYLLLDNC